MQNLNNQRNDNSNHGIEYHEALPLQNIKMRDVFQFSAEKSHVFPANYDMSLFECSAVLRRVLKFISHSKDASGSKELEQYRDYV
jgi:hypothetical protein